MSSLVSTKTVLTADDFPFHSQIIRVLTTDTVNEGFKTLVKNNILSAPAYDPETKQYVGFFDLSDALQLIYLSDFFFHVVCTLTPKNLVKQHADEILKSEETITIGSIFDDSNSSLIDRPKWITVKPNDSLHHVIDLLAHGCKRVPIIEENGEISKIITQSAVVSALEDILKTEETKTGSIDGVFSKTLKQLNLGFKSVKTLNGDANTVKDAFSMMTEYGISAVGITDDDGALFTCITNKDIRVFSDIKSAMVQRFQQDGITKRTLEGFMDMSLRDFTAHARQSLHEVNISAISVVVRETTTLRMVIAKLAKTKKHRVFIVDEHSRPIGVVAVSDICTFIVDNKLF